VELRWGAGTHRGLVRAANEDAVLAEEGLYAVADGMGGHAAGEVASSIALSTLRARLVGGAVDSTAVTDAIRTANEAVHQRAVEQPRLRGMGTTLTVVAVARRKGDELELVLANVGDSRAYLLADGHLHQLTRDHSYVAELVAAGEISAEEALVHPHRHVVTRALGVEPLVAVDTWLVTPQPGDRLLLCSDGLVNEIDDEAIAALLMAVDDPQEAVDRLIAAANANGGRDNVTVVVLDVHGEPSADATPVNARVVEQELGGWLPLGVEQEFATSDTIEVPTTPPPGAARQADEDGTAEAAAEQRTRRPRRRRISTTGVVFSALVVAVFVAAFVIVAAYGRSGYFAGFDDDGAVVVFQGRPGGVLWFQPTVEERRDVTRDELQQEAIDRVESNPRYSSAAAVERFIDRILENEDNLVPTVTVPTTDAAGRGADTPPTTRPGSTTTAGAGG
jgi:protein phosphatase